jgi:hypothetical protein
VNFMGDDSNEKEKKRKRASGTKASDSRARGDREEEAHCSEVVSVPTDSGAHKRPLGVGYS